MDLDSNPKILDSMVSIRRLIFNEDKGSHVSLNASFTKGMPKSGDIALVSQSGAICVAMLEYAKMRNMGFSKNF